MTELCGFSAIELRDLIAGRALSPIELLDSCLARISQVNPAVNAIVTIDESGARTATCAAEAAVMRRDDLGPLHGPPLAFKNTEDTAGLCTTYGSAISADHVPEKDLGVVSRLRAGVRSLGWTDWAKWIDPSAWASGGWKSWHGIVHTASRSP